MLENRKLKLDLLALVLLAGVIFLAAALLSYDPADPPSKLVFPPHGQPANMCGHWGAVDQPAAVRGAGPGGVLPVGFAGFLDAVLLIRHEVNQPWLRSGGWLLSLLGVTALAAMALPGLSPGPVIGSGGYLGVMVKTLLQTQFANLARTSWR